MKFRGRGDIKVRAIHVWEWWKQMKKRDPKFEWKMPVNFYGKVVDQASQPVERANVRFQVDRYLGGWNH